MLSVLKMGINKLPAISSKFRTLWLQLFLHHEDQHSSLSSGPSSNPNLKTNPNPDHDSDPNPIPLTLGSHE